MTTKEPVMSLNDIKWSVNVQRNLTRILFFDLSLLFSGGSRHSRPFFAAIFFTRLSYISCHEHCIVEKWNSCDRYITWNRIECTALLFSCSFCKSFDLELSFFKGLGEDRVWLQNRRNQERMKWNVLQAFVTTTYFAIFSFKSWKFEWVESIYQCWQDCFLFPGSYYVRASPGNLTRQWTKRVHSSLDPGQHSL